MGLFRARFAIAPRWFFVCLFATVSVLAAAACGGSQNATVPAVPVAAPGALSPPPKTIKSMTSSGTTQVVTGEILAVSGNTLTVDAGSDCGKIPVTMSSSTTKYYNSLTLAPGLDVTATGHGDCSSSLAATKVALSGNQLTVSGTVSSVSGSGYLLDSDTCGHINITTGSQTTNLYEGSIVVGTWLEVTGYGGCSSSITATLEVGKVGASSSPTPAATATGSASTHVLTAVYLGSTSFTNWSAAAPWTTWASVTSSIIKSVSSTSMKIMYYTDPNRQETSDPLYTSDSTTFAHTCGGSKITTLLNQYVMTPSSENLATLWRQYAQSLLTSGRIDAFFEDNAGGLDMYGTSDFSAMPCDYNDSSWLAADGEMEQDFGYPVIYNGLGGLNGEDVSTSIALNSTTLGGMYEHCYAQTDTKPKTFDWNWRATENTEIKMAQAHKLFFCMGRDPTPPSYAAAIDGRRYVYASFMLTYDLGSSVLWDTYASQDGFNVLPETQLVAKNPLVSTPSDISGLLTSSGMYAREYGACYIKGVSVGSCAFVVNPDYYYGHTFPYTKYHHSLTMSGGGILEGGTISASGSAPPTTLPALGSAIVFP